MRFLAPTYLHLAWLALVPLALWLYRRQAQRVRVSTLLFFKSLAREHQESAWLRRIKRWLALALTLFMLALAVLALARPAADSIAADTGAAVLLLDCSASMAALDERGETRLTAAKAALRRVVQALPEEAALSLILYEARPEVRLSRSRNRRECLRLLEAAEVIPVQGDEAQALAVAKRLAELDAGARLWLASDHVETTSMAEKVSFLDVALPRVVNVGITGFQLRPSPLAVDAQELFIRVSAAAANETKVSTTLEVTLAGRLAQLRELELAPGAAETLILPMEAVRGQQVEARLRTPGDVLSEDDAAATPLPKSRAIRVAWLAEKADPFTTTAMASLAETRRVEITRGEPAAWPLKAKPDVYVFEHWLPPEWPMDRPVIALNPMKSSGPLTVKPLAGRGVPHASVRSAAPEHAVLFRVASARVALTQTSVLGLPPSLEPLWMAANEPVLAAGEQAGQRVVVSAFDPAASEQLALLPAFPLLLGNALYWCAESTASTLTQTTHLTGELLAADGLVKWHAWDGQSFQPQSEQASHGWLPLRKIGIWETADGRSGASVLASKAETEVPKQSQDLSPSALLPKREILPLGSLLANWPQRLLTGLLILLLLESWLLHRRAVY
jgi:hypothetical protein